MSLALNLFYSLSDDIAWLLVSYCDFGTVLAWRLTSRKHFAMAASVLFARYRDLIKPFVSNTHAFSDALRRHGAVISGSLALYYFIPCSTWQPNDMDVYVSYDEFPAFLHVLENDPALQFRPLLSTGDWAPSSSLSLDIAEVRKMSTPSARVVDVIRSRRSTPVSPLVQFWTSLLANFVTPDACVASFPRMVFNGKGYIKEFGMTSRDEAAMRKYTAREFRPGERFSFVPELWGTWKDPSYWQKDYFSDRKALVIDFRRRVQDSMPPLPIRPSLDGWKLVVPFPGGALGTCCTYIIRQLTCPVSR